MCCDAQSPGQGAMVPYTPPQVGTGTVTAPEAAGDGLT